MRNEPQVILVDEEDVPIGKMGKQEVHEKGLLHRAFSVFVVNNKKQILLQRRALTKYHSPGLWTNTCCSHPMPGEGTEVAAHRRLVEELGMGAQLRYLFKFIYKHEFENGLIEHELDHVFLGRESTGLSLNPEEVDGVKWMGLPEIEEDLKVNPQSYTPWFKIVFQRFAKELKDNIHDLV